ncbi:MAG: XylR family transcriptional regulator [Pirellulales bacterium]|nr:XylR family transcriptional regulator [Pirellulales bacterium]
MSTRPKIALLIESSRSYGRGLLRGIASYTRTHGSWSIYHHERSLGDDAPAWLKSWNGDGVIVRADSLRIVEQIRDLNLPTIDLRGRFQLVDIPLIETNDQVVVHLAVEHLLERGFRQFAFCGIPGMNYSDRRLSFLVERLDELQLVPKVFGGTKAADSQDTSSIEEMGMLDQKAIGQWLVSLPKPVGVMASNDARGRHVLEACREFGLRVPDEVAVLGVDNDVEICELSDPPLTSVEPNTERIGFEAAALMHRMLEHDAAPPQRTFIDPVGVVTRQSTDVLAIADDELVRAVSFIRENACKGITVSDVLRELSISRSSLERRFSKVFDSSPKAEIIRIRLARVKQLLVETDYSLPIIADMTGFSHAEYMSALFRNKTGTTPGSYRRAQSTRSLASEQAERV